MILVELRLNLFILLIFSTVKYQIKMLLNNDSILMYIFEQFMSFFVFADDLIFFKVNSKT